MTQILEHLFSKLTSRSFKPVSNHFSLEIFKLSELQRTILDDADSANRNMSHLRALHDALQETFLKVSNI